jgi:anti-sigma factor RsiW
MTRNQAPWLTGGPRCDDVAKRISAYLDERLPGGSSDALAAHLASCAECRAYLQQITLIRHLLPRLPKATPPALPQLRLRLQRTLSISH